MIIDSEKKLQQLENEIKALKSTYSISGGAMKTYLSYSDVYTIEDVIAESPFRLRFTSLFDTDQDILVSSLSIEQTVTSGVSYNLAQYCLINDQDGHGSVTLEIPLLMLVSTVRVGIATTVPGTFTRIM